MSDWILSVTETGQLRQEHDSYPDCSLYRRDDLIALVYREGDKPTVWHLMLSVVRNERDPEMADVIDAMSTLLPALKTCVVEWGILSDGVFGDTRCFRVTGQAVTPALERLQ